MLAAIFFASFGAPLLLPQELFTIQVRLESGAALPGMSVSLTGSGIDGLRVGRSARTDADGRVQVDAASLRDRQVRLSATGRTLRLGLGHPARGIPDTASAFDFVLDECLFLVGMDSLADVMDGREDAEGALLDLTPLGPDAIHGWGAIPYQGNRFDSVLAPAGERYLATIERPGRRPLAALIGPEQAHGFVTPAFSVQPESLATFSVGVSGARPVDGARISVELFPVSRTEAPGPATARIQASAIVGEGGGYGVAVPGTYALRASLVGVDGHAMAVVAPRQGVAEVDLEAQADALLNVHLVPAGGVELTVEGDTKRRRSMRFEQVTFEVRRDVASGSGSQWMRAEVMQLRESGQWRMPRQSSLASRFALKRSLAEGNYEVRIRSLGLLSTVSKVSVKAGEVSQAKVTW